MLASLKQLLASSLDCAGLFPPAQLTLLEAMKVYDRARSSPQSWLLGRFVLPASQLQEWMTLLLAFPEEFCSAGQGKLSVILSKDWAIELEQIRQLNQTISQQNYPIHIDALEVAPLSPAEIQQVCLNLPVGVNTFFEVPFDAEFDPHLKVLQQTGTAAKLRLGGVTSQGFPDTKQLGHRILALANVRVPFKATAGLHHALRGNYRLTYQPDSASTTMHGFLNVAALAAFAWHQKIALDQAAALLEESSIAPFQFTDTGISWRGCFLSLAEIAQSRQQFFRSFGSCSFQEPIDELYHLGLL